MTERQEVGKPFIFEVYNTDSGKQNRDQGQNLMKGVSEVCKTPREQYKKLRENYYTLWEEY